ncbi:MAG: UvrD-helicase domain-containing protein, partial [Oscillospiraceae bacterium]|nr:UvrD-helicase domain-containing protein [Oscillospiraceae bacterium]
MNNFSHLNDKQIEAVRTVDGPLLLLAGAGSGKTTVLINRIANLIQNENIAPYEIIAITFTNKAAGEMKARLERMSIANIDDVWASTFHSACAKILRRDIDKLGYDRSFTIYDTADTASLMKRILKEMDIDEKQFPHKMVLSYISRAKDDMMSAASFLAVAEKSRDPRLRIIGQIYMEYEKRLVNSNSLDFDDLILLTVRLFKEHPDVLVRYQKRFKHVLVDEYQDTNNLQYHLTAALAGGHGNICVVGDDDQSIYKFRGATIENILSFEKHFKNAKVIRLEQNYRSTSYILNAANDVIKNNTGRKGKNLWTENAVGDIPSLYIVDDERAEAQFVADTILESVTSGQNYQDHVILYRMNAQSNQFETAFKRNGIPYRVFGGTGFYERAEVKDMLAYLCVIHNPHDDVRLLRIINNPARGLGDTTISRVAAVAAELGTSIFNAIDECFKYENVKSAVGKLTKFVSMINELREIAATSPLDVLYDELLRKTGYIRMLEEKNFEENQSRIENVKELKTNIIAFMNESDGSLFDFLSETALYTDLDRDDQSSDRVFMMTMHSAKGLEFDTV